MPSSINIGGSWKQLAKVFVNIAGAWKQVNKGFVNIGGAWRSWLVSDRMFGLMSGGWYEIDPETGNQIRAATGISGAVRGAKDLLLGYTYTSSPAKLSNYNPETFAVIKSVDIHPSISSGTYSNGLSIAATNNSFYFFTVNSYIKYDVVTLANLGNGDLSPAADVPKISAATSNTIYLHYTRAGSDSGAAKIRVYNSDTLAYIGYYEYTPSFSPYIDFGATADRLYATMRIDKVVYFCELSTSIPSTILRRIKESPNISYLGGLK